MLVDTRKKPEGKPGFNPEVQNEALSPRATGGQKAGYVILFWILLGVITLWICPIVYSITKKNWFNRQQMKINQSTSGIQVQLAQRRDTLVKLVDATKSSIKFEKETLADVTKLRNLNLKGDTVKASNQIERAVGKVYAVFERYPDLKTTETIRDLMSAADYQERELAAARRLYNANANEFNEQLFVWPAIVIASKMNLNTFALFAATAEQRQDVSLKLN